jgi:hypothetical protein
MVKYVKCIECTSAKLFRVLAALGNHVQQVLVSDGGTYYVVLPDNITPDISRILSSHSTIAMGTTDKRVEELMGNTPMNLRSAIQTGRLSHPGREYQHLWDAVCEKARIVELTYTQRAANAALTVGLYALWGVVTAVNTANLLLKK